VIKDVQDDRFTESLPPPPPGGSQIHMFDSRLRFMMSTNGGASFSPALAFAKVVVRVTSSQEQGSTRYFNTEMLELNASGGSLPPGVMLRESPSKASLGRTSVRQGPALALNQISSFFDVFTELSLDGGQNWMPSTSSGVDVVLHDTDSDNDGLADDWERTYFGNLTHGPGEDVDGDGMTNLEELLAGTDPTDPSSVLRPGIGRNGSDLLLRFPTVVGHRYCIECKTVLGPLFPWQIIIDNIQGDGNVTTVVLPNSIVPGVPQRFYRITVKLLP
jgi:hypothetical protein